MLLTQDPRWLPFVARYFNDLPRFAMEVCGLRVTWQQLELYRSVQGIGSRTSVSSGHGCFAAGTEVMLASGDIIKVEDVEPGMRLMGPDGASSQAVTELKRGREAMYRFTYSDGTSHTVNESHHLCLMTRRRRKIRVSVRTWLSWDTEQRRDAAIYRLTKAAGDGKRARYRRLHIADVDALGEADYFGFRLDGDGRFLGGDFTVLSNTGKTLAISVIATWHLLCHYSVQNKGSIVILTAPKIEQVRNLAWKEITALQDRISTGPQGWIASYYTVEAERVYVKDHKMTWFVTAKTAPRGAPENLAGFHSEWMLIIADEASGVPDANFSTLTGALTDGRNRMLLTSQPTRPAGFFYDTHHKLSVANGGVWNSLVFNSEKSPLVDAKWLDEKAAEYGGRDTEEYAIKVRGEFPEKSSKYLIGRKAVEAAFARHGASAVIKPGDDFGWFILVDVAAGEYRDKSVIMQAKVSGFTDFGADARRMQVVRIPVCSNSIQPSQLAGQVHELATSLDNATVLVDAGGMGIIFAKMLEAFDTPNLVKVKWGNPCFQRRHKERFVNQRAQAVVGSRDAIRDGRLGFDPDCAVYKATILDQGSRIPYGYDEKARYQIARKGSKEWEGLPSPDLWDALSFGFLADAHFIIAEDQPMGTDFDPASEAVAQAQADGTAHKASPDEFFADA